VQIIFEYNSGANKSDTACFVDFARWQHRAQRAKSVVLDCILFQCVESG